MYGSDRTLFGAPNQHRVETLRPVERAVLELMQFFREATAARRKHKGNDLISLLLEIEEDGELLTEEEVHAQCVMLLFGGHETTRNLLGNGIYTLLRHAAETEELRENPGLIRSTVEELLRYESPVQYTTFSSESPRARSWSKFTLHSSSKVIGPLLLQRIAKNHLGTRSTKPVSSLRLPSR